MRRLILLQRSQQKKKTVPLRISFSAQRMIVHANEAAKLLLNPFVTVFILNFDHGFDAISLYYRPISPQIIVDWYISICIYLSICMFYQLQQQSVQWVTNIKYEQNLNSK